MIKLGVYVCALPGTAVFRDAGRHAERVLDRNDPVTEADVILSRGRGRELREQ